MKAGGVQGEAEEVLCMVLELGLPVLLEAHLYQVYCHPFHEESLLSR